jgi:hypothetical protein
LYGAGTAPNYLAGALNVGISTITSRQAGWSTIQNGEAIFTSQTSNGYTLFGRNIYISSSGNNIYVNSSTSAIFDLSGRDFAYYSAPTGTAGNAITFTKHYQLYGATGNLVIQNGGAYSDSGERLQVTGTAKITGASTFGGNMILESNQNASTNFRIRNTTSGTAAATELVLQNDTSSGSGSISKTSTTTIAYKFLLAKDLQIYNGNTAGDISVLNDFASGTIKFGAGASSTAQMTLTSAGNLCIGVTSGGDFLNIGAGTTAKAQINLASSTAPTSPNDGDIWFDGTNLLMRIGGVTKTFTLI